MTLNELHLLPETEAKLRERAAAAGKDVPAVVREIVEASLAEDDFDPEDIAAIREGLEQIDRGEVYTLEQVREHFRRRGMTTR